MSSNSNIEWTDTTWNPVVGCTRASSGCDSCYAVAMTKRLEAMGQPKYAGLVNAGKSHFNGVVRCVEEDLTIPLHWKKPRRVFVNSMSDLFHENVPFDFIDKVFAVMALCPQHTFQVLTKRPERMSEYLTLPFSNNTFLIDRNDRKLPFPAALHRIKQARFKEIFSGKVPFSNINAVFESDFHWQWPLPNVWLGTSIESQEHIPRAWDLLKCPAAVRFLSLEPLLGPVDLNKAELLCATWRRGLTIGIYLDWVIVGGESGHNARPCKVTWIRSIVEQCKAAGVPVFVKQLGSKPMAHVVGNDGFNWPSGTMLANVTVCDDGTTEFALNDRKGGDPEEWPEDLRVRQFPEAAR